MQLLKIIRERWRMCGIAGLLNKHLSSNESTAVLALSMANQLRHRGPDADGVWSDPEAGVALAHRRLSIIDASEGGAQPMLSACGRYVLTYNGELYNSDQLRTLIEGVGRRQWRGYSDTEVLLEALATWGINATLPMLNGMFAFALWDRSQHVLHLARDRFGEKPIYFGWVGKSFVFASQPTAFRVLPGWSGRVNRQALRLLMRYASVPAPHSIYDGILKLPAACTVSINSTMLYERILPEPRSYWNLREAIESAEPWKGSSEEAIDSLDRRLSEAVRRRMRADVPLGALLSGGIDSSSIVALMQANSTDPVRTFSIGFGETEYNEAVYASQVAKHLGTKHTEYIVSAKDSLDIVPRLPQIYDEPFADASQIPTFLVCALARNEVAVCLSGDGADELFGGYDRYRTLAKFWRSVSWLPASMRTAVSAAILQLPTARLGARPVRGRRVGERIQNAALLLGAQDFLAMYQRYVSHWQTEQDPVEGAMLADDGGSIAWKIPGRHPTACMMAWDCGWYLGDDLLVKLDRASMAVSLETRVPFLDPALFELSIQLPLNFRVRAGEGKWLLRQVLHRYVPPALVDRPKRGFAVPLAQWLRGPLRAWAEALLDPMRLRNDGYLKVDVVRGAWKEHLENKRDWQYPLWNVLMFQQWLQSGIHRPIP